MVNLAGNFSNSGTFTSGTGVFTFNGSSPQTLTGVTTFTSMTVANSAGLNLANNITVTTAAAGTLTLTSGAVTTGANTLITARACNAPSVARTSGYVVGNLRKAIPANASTCTFEIGSGANYTPVVAVFIAGTTAGNITASTTGTEHASIGASGIDSAKSVNRYWTLTNGGVTLPAAGFSATFNFINGSPVDFDAIAAPANFIVERWNGANWFPTTLNPACTSTPGTNLCKRVNGLTATTFGDFAIGEARTGFNSSPGAYNVFETATSAGAILGYIQTKIAGIGFTVDVVHINAAKTGVLAGAITVEVRLLDSSSGGALDANNCSSAGTWPLIQAQPNFNIPAGGRGTIPAVTVNNSYRDVRFQIRSPVGGPYTQIGCSTDRFAIRPQSLTTTALDLDWQNAGTARALNNTGASGGNVHKASEPAAATPRPFTLRATPVPAGATNYDGTPTTVSGFPSCAGLGALCTSPGALSFTAGAWTSAGSGVRENATAHYSEAGAFNLQLEDTSYASVDAVDGTPAATRTIPATATAQIGRFVPAYFDVTTLVTPVFRTFNAADAACSAGAAPRRTFTYIGQPFGYATTPQATIIARNAAGTTTANYQGSLWKIGGVAAAAKNCTTAPDTNTCVYTTSFGATGGTVTETYTYSLVPIATPGWDNGAAVPAAASVASNNDGTGTITYASSDLLGFQRSTTTPLVPFAATINNTLGVTDNAEGVGQVITTSSPAAFNAIAFDAGNLFRYGRLRLQNANGSQLIAMPLPLQAQYWNGSGFVLNADDNCTVIEPGNVALGNYQRNLNAGETVVSGAGTLSAGVATLRLSAPGAANNGSVDVSVNLTGGTAGASCTAGMPASTGSNLIHLQGLWCTPPGTYTSDPTARATFGLYRDSDQRVYQRENY